MGSVLEKKYVTITPGVCGGRPHVVGHRVRVQDIVIWTEQGQSPDEIVHNIPSITVADVYGALAYYHDHRSEIDQAIHEDKAFIEQMKSEIGVTRFGSPKL